MGEIPGQIPKEFSVQAQPKIAPEVKTSKVKQLASSLKSILFAPLSYLYNPWRPKEKVADKNVSTEPPPTAADVKGAAQSVLGNVAEVEHTLREDVEIEPEILDQTKEYLLGVLEERGHDSAQVEDFLSTPFIKPLAAKFYPSLHSKGLKPEDIDKAFNSYVTFAKHRAAANAANLEFKDDQEVLKVINRYVKSDEFVRFYQQVDRDIIIKDAIPYKLDANIKKYVDENRPTPEKSTEVFFMSNKPSDTFEGFLEISQNILIREFGYEDKKIDDFLASDQFQKFFQSKDYDFFASFLPLEAKLNNQKEVISAFNEFVKQKKHEEIIYLSATIQKAKEDPSYEENALKAKKEFLDQFGFSDEMQMSLMESPSGFQIEDLIYYQKTLQQSDPLLITIYDEMRKILMDECGSQLDNLCEELKHPFFLSNEQIKKNSLSLMAILNFFSENLPIDDYHENEWKVIYNVYLEVLKIKKNSESPTVQQQLEEAFETYQTLIEDGLAAYQLRVEGGISAEDLTKVLYGKTADQYNKIKKANRIHVVDKLVEFASQVVEDGQPITIEMLKTLHLTNNRGIVPKHISRMRKMKNEDVSFGKRVGVIPRDVEPAVQEVLDMANRLIRNPPRSNLLYSIQVAKLHNRLLDIHPFMDRNGSTSLLFMELLMAARGGYHPPKNRISNYNANIYKILNNSVAVAIVSYEHYKIINQFGHYTSRSLVIDDEAKKYYDNQIAKRMRTLGSEPKSTKDTMKSLLANIKKIYGSKGQD